MSRPRLIYLVIEDWAFTAHRLPMARAARDAGYEVHVAARVNRDGETIRTEGFQLHPVGLHRGSVNPFKFLSAACAVRRLYRQVSPALVHHVALQSVVLGSIAAIGLSVAQVNSVVGFGSVFTAHTMKSRLVRIVLRLLLPTLLNRKSSLTLVENPDNRAQLIALGVKADRVTVFPGSGVDVDHFVPLPEPAGPITVAFAGRMLEDKGVRTLVHAQQILWVKAQSVHLVLAGMPDSANPNSLTSEELIAWSKLPGVRWLGHVADVRTVWAQAHIVALASRGEGMPVSLLEAAACGRPIVATDVSGCREVARDGVNALLVPPDDPTRLANAIDALAKNPGQRRDFGAAGRRLVEEQYSSGRVGTEIVVIYDRVSGSDKKGP